MLTVHICISLTWKVFILLFVGTTLIECHAKFWLLALSFVLHFWIISFLYLNILYKLRDNFLTESFSLKICVDRLQISDVTEQQKLVEWNISYDRPASRIFTA